MNHLSAIGFPVTGEEDLHRIIILARERGKLLRSARGLYILWAPGDGVELWVQRHDSGPLSLTPHFRGSGIMQVGVTGFYEHPSAPMCGSLQGVAAPTAGDHQAGAHPVFFDVPDFDLARHAIEADAIVTIQLAGFAQGLRAFAQGDRPSDEEGGGANGLFIPIGLYGATGDRANRPRALATFSGRVERVRLRCNPVTWKPFHHLVVRTRGGTFDIVVAPETLEGTAEVGGIVSGTGWFTGRMILDPGRRSHS